MANIFKLYAYDYEDNKQHGTVFWDDWTLNLMNGEESGITSISIDSRIEKRFTRFKFMKETKDNVSGKGGTKIDHREIVPKNRERENFDIQVQGWLSGDNASETASLLDYYGKLGNLAVLLVTDQMNFYSGGFYWNASNRDKIASNADSKTDWYAGQYPGGMATGNVDLDTTQQVEGTGCVKYVESSAAGGQTYAIRYNPVATFSLLTDYVHSWWFATRQSSDWDNVRVYIVDSDADYVYWDIDGNHTDFNYYTWTELELDPDDGYEIGTMNWGSINYIDWRVTQKAGDSTNFILYVDWTAGYGSSYRKRDIPFFSVESVQTQKRGGLPCNRYDYTLKLKRVKSPPGVVT